MFEIILVLLGKQRWVRYYWDLNTTKAKLFYFAIPENTTKLK